MAERTKNGKFVAKEKPAMSTGFGESKRFIADPGTYEPNSIDWATLTLGGEPIPEHQWGLIPYAVTDQGKAEAEQKIEENGGRSKVEFLGRRVELPGGHNERGEYVPSQTLNVDGTRAGADLQQFADRAKAGFIDEWDTGPAGAMVEARDRYVKPGFVARFLSPNVMRLKGQRGYEIVKDEKGNDVKIDSMVLAQMPIETAQRKRSYLNDKSKEQMVRTQEQVLAQSDQVASQSRTDRMTRRDRSELNTGFESVRGDERELEDRDFAATL